MSYGFGGAGLRAGFRAGRRGVTVTLRGKTSFTGPKADISPCTAHTAIHTQEG